jgi:hypothetical protein
MAQITIKKSSVANKVPLSTDLAYGELALNYQDGKLYFKTATNTIEYFNMADPIVVITKSITLTTDWQDTGIKSTDLATGTYLVQLYANDLGVGGNNNNEYYSGTMSWYSGSTDSSVAIPTDEIVLHRAGASSDGGLYLRTYRSLAADSSALKLQIYANIGNLSSSNYVFKFRRMM